MLPSPQQTFKDLVEQFVLIERSGEIDEFRQRKWGHFELVDELSQEQRLLSLSLEEAELIFRGLPIPQSNRSRFLSNSIKDIRESLWFLLYGEAPYEIRAWELLDELGGYRLIGVDRPFVSALLCIKDPLLFGLANARVERALRRLRLLPKFDSKESNAGKLQKIQEALWRVSQAAGFSDFTITDDFLESLDKNIL